MPWRGQANRFGQRTWLMGVINLTPDSFSGDGLGSDWQAAAEQARRFADDGADWLDLGAESTRPGAPPVSADEELARLLPALEAVTAAVDLPVSVDTRRAGVARRAVAAGASMINDITGLTGDPDMAGVVAEAGVPVVIQHIQGTPQTMQAAPVYDDVVDEVTAELRQRLALAEAAGIPRQHWIVDPGIGFGKTLAHNLRLLRRLGEFRALGCPILVGVSRKRFLGEILDREAMERLHGTAAAVAVAIAHGADIVRVHDVAVMHQVVQVADAIVRPTLSAGWADRDD